MVVEVSVVTVGTFLNVILISLVIVDGRTVSWTTGREVTVKEGWSWARGLKAAPAAAAGFSWGRAGWKREKRFLKEFAAFCKKTSKGQRVDYTRASETAHE